jgi:hypothetical protein
MIPHRPCSARRLQRAFTLVELMVALTGGLFVAVVVFTLAKDGSRFYMREARVADATLAVVTGFKRLRHDLARAAFQSTRNIRSDQRLCGQPTAWPGELSTLAGLRIRQSPVPAVANADLARNNIVPDDIVIAGNFQSVDLFPMIGVTPTAGGFRVQLQTNIGPLVRTSFAARTGNLVGQREIVEPLFPPNRALRIVDQSGAMQYGIIVRGDVDGNGPHVLLTQNSPITPRSANQSVCGLNSLSRGYVNVVNLVRYQVRALNLATAPGYAPLTSAFGQTPWDASRTELIRDELNVGTSTVDAPVAIPNTEEVVSEYAVDLKFGVTFSTGAGGDVLLSGSVPPGPPNDANLLQWAGNVATIAVPITGPQFVRAVRVRLSVRAREPDRELNILPSPAGGPVALGLYRFQLDQAVSAGSRLQWARVRTLQADVALNNQMSLSW